MCWIFCVPGVGVAVCVRTVDGVGVIVGVGVGVGVGDGQGGLFGGTTSELTPNICKSFCINCCNKPGFIGACCFIFGGTLNDEGNWQGGGVGVGDGETLGDTTGVSVGPHRNRFEPLVAVSC